MHSYKIIEINLISVYQNFIIKNHFNKIFINTNTSEHAQHIYSMRITNHNSMKKKFILFKIEMKYIELRF